MAHISRETLLATILELPYIPAAIASQLDGMWKITTTVQTLDAIFDSRTNYLRFKAVNYKAIFNPAAYQSLVDFIQRAGDGQRPLILSFRQHEGFNICYVTVAKGADLVEWENRANLPLDKLI